MKVKFIQNVQLSDSTIIREGDVFQAREEGDFIMIRLPIRAALIKRRKHTMTSVNRVSFRL